MLRCLFFLFLIFACIQLFSVEAGAQESFEITRTDSAIPIGKYASVYYDSSGTSDYSNIKNVGTFISTHASFPVIQVRKGFVWIKTKFTNKTADSLFFFNLQYANISHISLFKETGGKLYLQYKGGNAFPFKSKERVTPNFVFPVNLAPGDSAIYYFKITSKHPVLFPLMLQDSKSIILSINFQTIIIGIYLGIILAILFYNLFLYISTRDASYLMYVSYLIFLGLAQLTLSGFAFKYLWPSHPAINKYALTVSSSLAGISGIIFAIFFLRIKKYVPKTIPVLFVLILTYLAAITFSFFDNNFFSYQILNFAGLVGGVVLIIIAFNISRMGYKPAYFYLVAWLTFLLGMVVFVLRNINVLPYNNFTTYILYGGSAIEVILLSIALADKINVLRKEKEESQARSLEVSLENERLVREQNAQLEKKVAERTNALQGANLQLTNAFKNLKDAQIQLVEAEKMASLGQLTAGIAHEINNPINFVKSNIKPLTLDINDLVEVIEEYEKLHEMPEEDIPRKLSQINAMREEIDLEFVKTEINNLLKGVEDGAERTAEIVRGLRTFSRLDESQLKTVDIHEGIDSTLVILRNYTPDNVNIIRHYNGDGNIECYPGKLNQVFMNILSNAIHAIKLKPRTTRESITITTRDLGSKFEIRIKDTGPGMTEEVKRKIFDPFFTTKDVGEGTGLGMAIVFKIIQEHCGSIEVDSTAGIGAEFIITLHRNIPEKPFI